MGDSWDKVVFSIHGFPSYHRTAGHGSGGVGAVKSDVLFAEITAPGGGGGVPQIQVKAKANLRAAHREDYCVLEVRYWATPFHNTNVVDVKGYATFVQLSAAVSKGNNDSAPVGVTPMNRRLDQGG